MALDEYGREAGVDYREETWTIDGDTTEIKYEADLMVIESEKTAQ